MLLNKLAMIFYVIALILMFFFWITSITVVGLISYCFGFLGLALSTCILITDIRKKKSKVDDNSQS